VHSICVGTTKSLLCEEMVRIPRLLADAIFAWFGCIGSLRRSWAGRQRRWMEGRFLVSSSDRSIRAVTPFKSISESAAPTGPRGARRWREEKADARPSSGHPARVRNRAPRICGLRRCTSVRTGGGRHPVGRIGKSQIYDLADAAISKGDRSGKPSSSKARTSTVRDFIMAAVAANTLAVSGRRCEVRFSRFRRLL
jgi:hypothetical protein